MKCDSWPACYFPPVGHNEPDEGENYEPGMILDTLKRPSFRELELILVSNAQCTQHPMASNAFMWRGMRNADASVSIGAFRDIHFVLSNKPNADFDDTWPVGTGRLEDLAYWGLGDEY